MARPFQGFGLIALACALVVIASGNGQSAPANAQESSSPPQDLVDIFFTVADGHGRLVQGLTQDQFTILDREKPARQIVVFERSTAAPMRLALVIDASNSMRDALPVAQSALEPFIRTAIRPDSDKALVVAFDQVIDVVKGLTGDSDQLIAATRKTRAGGGSAMWDAVYFVSRDILAKENGGAFRRIMLLVSDGEDNQSHVKQEEAVRMAQRARVTVYSISTSGRQDTGTWKLRDLSEATGGRTFMAGRTEGREGMDRALAELAEELHNQYRISYIPDDFSHDGKFRPIQVHLTDSKLKASVAKGYYAPAQ